MSFLWDIDITRKHCLPLTHDDARCMVRAELTRWGPIVHVGGLETEYGWYLAGAPNTVAAGIGGRVHLNGNTIRIRLFLAKSRACDQKPLIELRIKQELAAVGFDKEHDHG